MKRRIERSDSAAALRIIAIYGLFAALWIYFSDTALDLLVHDRAILVRISVFKGFLFIAVTSLILYQLIVRYVRKTTESENLYRSLFENMQEGYAHCRMIFDDSGNPADFVYLEVNEAFTRLTGLTDVVGKRITEIIPGRMGSYPEVLECYGRVASTGKSEQFETEFTPLDKWFAVSVYSRKQNNFVALFHDISERKDAEKAREVTIDLLRICNGAESKRELMRELTGFFHRLTGCEAVGVRLREGEDFPYYETHGFDEEFVLLEKSLCAYDQDGDLHRDNLGHPAYGCMCGNVLSSRFDPAQPFFTQRGSFWSSCTSELLAATSDEERLARTRNRCNGEGYESVALVPLRSHGETFGLFQFNDRARGRFTAEKIALYEELVSHVAIALAKLSVEEALLESSEFSKQVIRSAEEGIIVYGRDMRYQIWNPFMERLTGRKACDVIGREPLECFPFLRESEVIGNIEKALNAQQLASTEFLFTPSGSAESRWISDTCVPLRNTKGEIIGVIGIVLDITSSKRTEEELKEVSQRLQLATAAGHLGIWDWDLISDRMIWNERMFELYGVSLSKFRISRETWENSIHPDDLAMAREETRAALGGERDYSFDFRIVNPDGNIRHIKTNALVIRDEGGRPVRMTGMSQDVTERRHLEDQLRQSQKMEAIGQLAGGIAHDFNNILTAIYGYCNVLQMKMGNDSPYRPDIDHIFGAAERAANLTRSLLAFSRKQIMTPRTVNMNDIVLNVGKLLTRIIGEDIRLKTEITANPILINADSGQIEQVLMNLAANARDAMPKGGILTIETGLRDIDEGFTHAHGYGVPGKYAVISVSDSGSGMDTATSKKIFEPFFTTKEVGKGTGLGLAIVYGVVKQHGGFINVYSEPGSGTVFRIYLQLAGKEIGDATDGKIVELPPMGSETILLAEDDKSIQLLAESVLRQFGYGVILADDGIEAMEKFNDNRGNIDIIVMDMIMPKMNGRETFEEISRIKPGMKVIFMSGYSQDLLQNRGILASGEEVLIKPFQPLDLVRKVRRILDGG